MRRIVLLMAALLALPGTVATASEPEVFAAAAQDVSADWIRIKGSSGEWYIAMASRFPSDQGLITIGGIGRGFCFVETIRKMKMVTCIASLRVKEIPAEAFVMDPALTQAQLSVKQGGRTHTVTWVGKGDAPEAATETSWGSDGSHGALVAYRNGTATGKVFGKSFTSRRGDIAEMFEGAMVGIALDDTRVTEISPNHYRLKKTFRLPH
jgi:hypothetical protein